MPHPLLQRVVQIAERARRVAVLAAVGRVLAVALGVALLLMVADYVMRLSDPGMRWLFAGLLLMAVVAAAHRWLSGAAWRGVTPLAIAQQIQADRPTLGSRLASAIEFLQQRTDDPSAGSADLRRAVVVKATADIERLDEQRGLEEVIDHRPLRRAVQWIAACLAAAVIFGLADPAGLKTAAARLVAPWSDQSWPRRNHLVVREAPDRIARGQAFEARVADEEDVRLPADLRVQYRTRVGGKTRVEEQMLPSTGARVTLQRENVQQAFAFRITGGDDQTMPWRKVDVVDPPRLAGLSLTATPPTYSGLPAHTLREDDRALAGAAITLEATSDEQLASGALLVRVDNEVTELPLTVATSDSGATSLALAEPWRAATNGAGAVAVGYRVRVTSADGLEGQGKARVLRVEPDTPPSIEWVEPASESLVTARAVVPVRVLAEDNLAIAQAELLWRPEEARQPTPLDPAAEQADEPQADDAEEPPVERISIYAGPESPPQRGSLPWDAPADSRELTHHLQLEPLGLAPGDQILLTVEATDYRPGVGATPLPRRVIIISDEEFDSRLADMQSELVQDLSRLLAEQREARAAAGELSIDRQADPQTSPQTLDRLSALGFEQLRINQGVSDERRGAAARAEQLLEELERNRQDRQELKEQLESLRDGLRQLADGPLAGAGRDLADARRSAEQAAGKTDPQAEKEVDKSLAQASGKQDRAIETLEQMVERMSNWSDFQRFAQELSELEREQRGLREETLKEAARAAASLPTPERAAARAKLRAAQAEIAKRFGKLQDAMRKAVDQSRANQSQGDAQQSDATQALQDALAESRDNATRGKLEQAERQLGAGQLGRSASEQQAGADDIRSMLETLRDRASSDPKELAEQLRDAQEKLAELQKKLDELKQQADQPAQERQQKKLADQTERMSRKLDRLGAQQAGQSTQQGAEKMEQSAEQSRQGESGSEKLAQAQEQLKQAQEQLEQEIQKQKQLQALKVLDRLAGKLGGYIERQTKLLEGTVGADQESQAGAEGEDFEAGVRQLADDQRELREEVEVARRNVSEREVFELALRGAVGDMDQAIELLAKPEVARPTQQRQYSALQRLKHVSDALKLNPPPEEEKQEQQGGGGEGGQQGQPKPPSPVDVAELKMLRLMQLDVNAQTRNLEAEAADNRLPTDEARRRADELSGQQQRLGDLVQELIDRINERQTNPGELPDDAA